MSTRDARPLRLAFFGCGRAAATHSRILAAAEGVTLSFASRDPDRAAGYRLEFGGDIAYASYDEALADPTLDGVVVATPPERHLEQTLAALAAGKHVVVEKPAWPHAADVRRVRSVAAAAARQVLVAENYAYKPLLRRLRRLLGDGAVGEPRFITVNAMRAQRVPGWREESAVGALYEGGIHWLSLLADLGFTIERVYGIQPGPAGGPDRSMLVVLEYREGPVATLHYSWEVPTLFRGLGLSRIAGTAGVITFETNGLFVLTRGRRRGVWFPQLGDIAGYKAMWKDFIASLRSGAEPRMSLGAAERDLSLVEAVYACLD